MVYFPPGFSPEWIAQFKANKRREESVRTKSAAALAGSLGMDAAAVKDALHKIQRDYGRFRIGTEDIEKAAQAKKDLLNLAKKASELEAAMFALGQGAIEAMNRRTVRQDLISEAEPFNLPSRDPSGPCPRSYSALGETLDIFGHDDVDFRGGRWVIRLHALAELARVKADRIEKQAGKGGRKSFGARLHGSPEEWLARACKEFAEAHGCTSQSVVLKMVRAILEAERGKEAMRQMDGRPKRQAGRKAVQKVFQTKP